MCIRDRNAVRSPVPLLRVARLDNTDKIASHECPYIKLLLIGFSKFQKVASPPRHPGPIALLPNRQLPATPFSSTTYIQIAFAAAPAASPNPSIGKAPLGVRCPLRPALLVSFKHLPPPDSAPAPAPSSSVSQAFPGPDPPSAPPQMCIRDRSLLCAQVRFWLPAPGSELPAFSRRVLQHLFAHLLIVALLRTRSRQSHRQNLSLIHI